MWTWGISWPKPEEKPKKRLQAREKALGMSLMGALAKFLCKKFLCNQSPCVSYQWDSSEGRFWPRNSRYQSILFLKDKHKTSYLRPFVLQICQTRCTDSWYHWALFYFLFLWFQYHSYSWNKASNNRLNKLTSKKSRVNVPEMEFYPVWQSILIKSRKYGSPKKLNTEKSEIRKIKRWQ